MSAVKLAVIGAGSLEVAIPMVASLATYFGERPLDIVFYHPEEEPLDLVDRFARLCFLMTKSTHSLRSTVFLDEAIAEADRFVLLSLPRLDTGGRPTLDMVASAVPPGIGSESSLALQILRWLNGEEYPFEVMREQETSRLKTWLDGY